jgi:putative peptidoglycan lipid II flippase
MINRMVGSNLPEGAISGLNYAFLIYQILPSVVISAMGGAILPSLSEASAANDRPAMENRFGKALRITWWISIPAAAFLLVFAIPVVQLIFQRGAFDAHDTWITATSLQYYAPSLIPMTFMSLGFQVFYASKITRIPLWISLVSIATSVAFNLTLVRFMDHRGLALALTLSSLVGMAMTLYSLQHRFRFRLRSVWRTFAWFLATTTLVSAIVFLCDRTFLNTWPLLLRLSILLFLFIACYLAMNLISIAPMSGELRTAIRSAWSRLRRKPKAEK